MRIKQKSYLSKQTRPNEGGQRTDTGASLKVADVDVPVRYRLNLVLARRQQLAVAGILPTLRAHAHLLFVSQSK